MKKFYFILAFLFLVGTASAQLLVQQQNKGNIISLTTPNAMTVGDADQTMTCTSRGGTSWGASPPTNATYTSNTTSYCTIVSNKLHAVAAGTCTVTAADPGGAGWGPAVSATSGNVTISAASAGIVLNLNYQTTQTDSGTIAITKPTGTVDTDFLLACITDSTSSNWTTGVPTGWTALDTYSNYSSGGQKVVCWYRRSSGDSGVSSWTWTQGGSGSYADGFIWRMTGVVSTGSPLDVAVGHSTDAGTAISSAAITTSTNGAAVIQIGSTTDDYTSIPTHDMTVRINTAHQTFATADTQATAGSTGAKAATIGTSRTWGTILMALKPQ